MYIMSSTPLIASSSGVATVSEITLGLAPGYTVRTTTEGGTTSGYSLIGRIGIAIRPAAKITIESTAAKIGRSMKKWENFTAGILSWERRYGAPASAGWGCRGGSPMAIATGATGMPGKNTFCTP